MYANVPHLERTSEWEKTDTCLECGALFLYSPYPLRSGEFVKNMQRGWIQVLWHDFYSIKLVAACVEKPPETPTTSHFGSFWWSSVCGRSLRRSLQRGALHLPLLFIWHFMIKLVCLRCPGDWNRMHCKEIVSPIKNELFNSLRNVSANRQTDAEINFAPRIKILLVSENYFNSSV